MMRRNSLGNIECGKASLAGSARSTPRMTPCTSHGAHPMSAVDLFSAAVTVDSSSSGNNAVVTPPPQPFTHLREKPFYVTVAENQRKKKGKAKEKKGHPQNALFSLACAGNGGVALSANVVDLRCLESSSPQISCKRSIHVLNEDVPPTQILKFLYLGSVRDAQDPAFLANNHIRYIINVSQEEYWSVDKRVQIFTFKVDDSATADIGSLFAPTRSLINSVRERYYRSEAAGKSSRPAVLVHCQKGRSRSVTIVLAYLIYMNGWSVAEAMRYVATRRPCAEPNIGFMEELRKLQESLNIDERTKRYSELCWFMRNLDAASTSVELVQEAFEQRVGLVRGVVMLTAPGSNNKNGGNDSSKEPNRSGVEFAGGNINGAQGKEVSIPTKITYFSMGDKDAVEEKEGGAAAVPQSADGEEYGAETREYIHLKSPFNASSASTVGATDNTVTNTPGDARKCGALCFVFLTCREDVLRGIKSGQMRDILEALRPAPGKQIKYATGPKLRKLMTEHQPMSSSFAQGVTQFGGGLGDGPGAAGGDADAANKTKKL